MDQKPTRPRKHPASPQRPGETARAAGRTLNSCRVGALPVLDRFIERLRLEQFLRDHLPRDDRRSRVPTATGLLLLLKNLLMSREPLYGLGEWAARHVPELLGLSTAQLPSLNDDRVGRCLDRLFDADIPTLSLAVVAYAVREFDVELDELHNDSTTITFHGDYESADRERTLRGRLRLAITWGHNKDHRPDLKQLLYILTVTRDGAVPVQFRVQSGNATDDRSHRATWDLLCKLTGRHDFLYVADCKLATAENMAFIHDHGGRFLSVLPVLAPRTPPSGRRSWEVGSVGNGFTTSTMTVGIWAIGSRSTSRRSPASRATALSGTTARARPNLTLWLGTVGSSGHWNG